MLGVAYLTAINDESTQVVSIVGKDESFEDGTTRLLGYATVAELDPEAYRNAASVLVLMKFFK